MNWYNNIEKGLRRVVKLLRDNGVNTTYSCHHAMVIEAEGYEAKQADLIYDLLCSTGYDGFTIEFRIFKERDQAPREGIVIQFHKCPKCST